MSNAETTVLQLLTFRLDEEIFAFDVAKVQEVLELLPITRVPRTPDFMRGVINNRGSVVPVVDLRLKFGLPRQDDSIDTCIIILEITSNSESAIIGSLVDGVEEVVELKSDEIQPPPKIGTRLETQYIRGMGKRGDSFIIILDSDTIFSVDQLTEVQAAGTEPDHIKTAGNAE